MEAFDRIIWAQTGKGTRIGTAFDRIAALRDAVERMVERRVAVVTGGLLISWYAQQARAIGFEFHREAAGTVLPEINHGRWIVKCSVCGGAEEAAPEDPFFYCLSCGNADNGGHPMRVIFPEQREEIEGILLVRQMENRNWLPNESVDDLEIENLKHGVIK